MKNTQVGELMRARRDTLKLSMRAAALRGGTSPSTWSDVEGGHRTNLEASTQRAIAQGLGWEFDWLDRILAGDEPIEVSPSGDESPDALLRQDVADLQLAVAAIGRAVVAAGFLEQATLDGLLRSPGSAGRSERSAR